MPLLQLAVLALIQGITEFLPISSSGHLALVHPISGWPDQGLAIDVAVHVGTLFAVIIYFWRDLWHVLASLVRRKRQNAKTGRALAGHLVVATIPVIAAGAAVAFLAPDLFRDAQVIAWATILFAVALYLADRLNMTVRRVEHMGYGHAIIIGLAQMLALIPGTSRSGITMTAARALGYERGDAARFSMLLSIPVIVAAGLVAGADLAEAETPIVLGDAAIAAGLSFATALLSIAGLMALLRRISFTPFVVYRILLGAGLLVWLYALA